MISSSSSEPEASDPKRFLEAERPLSPILLWAALVGILVGLVGVCFEVAIEQITYRREYLITLLKNYPGLNILLSVVLSAVMVHVAFLLMRRFAPEVGGSGIPQIEGALDGILPIRWQRVIPVKFSSGILSIGGGMVLGREGPTIQMGGSIGQMIGTWVHCTPSQVKTLVAAGAGAGLTTAFGAPIAGILFVIEEMRPQFEYTVSSVRAVTTACIAAAIVVQAFLGPKPSVDITQFENQTLQSLWLFVILGILIGIVGYCFNALLIYTLNFFANLQSWYRFTGLLIGGFFGFLVWLYPPVTGGGEQTIFWAFDNNEPTNVLVLVFLARFGLTMLSYGSGAPGGIFAPMLAIATVFSLVFSRYVLALFPTLISKPDVFTVAGMGALVAATVRAPLTAITLTIEMTQNYQLILPLLLTCLTAAIVAHALGGEPIYSVLLERTLKRR